MDNRRRPRSPSPEYRMGRLRLDSPDRGAMVPYRAPRRRDEEPSKNRNPRPAKARSFEKHRKEKNQVVQGNINQEVSKLATSVFGYNIERTITSIPLLYEFEMPHMKEILPTISDRIWTRYSSSQTRLAITEENFRKYANIIFSDVCLIKIYNARRNMMSEITSNSILDDVYMKCRDIIRDAYGPVRTWPAVLSNMISHIGRFELAPHGQVFQPEPKHSNTIDSLWTRMIYSVPIVPYEKDGEAQFVRFPVQRLERFREAAEYLSTHYGFARIVISTLQPIVEFDPEVHETEFLYLYYIQELRHVVYSAWNDVILGLVRNPTSNKNVTEDLTLETLEQGKGLRSQLSFVRNGFARTSVNNADVVELALGAVWFDSTSPFPYEKLEIRATRSLTTALSVQQVVTMMKGHII